MLYSFPTTSEYSHEIRYLINYSLLVNTISSTHAIPSFRVNINESVAQSNNALFMCVFVHLFTYSISPRLIIGIILDSPLYNEKYWKIFDAFENIGIEILKHQNQKFKLNQSKINQSKGQFGSPLTLINPQTWFDDAALQ